MVKVRTKTRLYEKGMNYEIGDIFETTEERAKQLADDVEIVEEKEVTEDKKKDKMVRRKATKGVK